MDISNDVSIAYLNHRQIFFVIFMKFGYRVTKRHS